MTLVQRKSAERSAITSSRPGSSHSFTDVAAPTGDRHGNARDAPREGGVCHDGRSPTLAAVIEHYDRNFRLGLTSQEKAELVEYLKSL
jgi:hypothetical protein